MAHRNPAVNTMGTDAADATDATDAADAAVMSTGLAVTVVAVANRVVAEANRAVAVANRVVAARVADAPCVVSPTGRPPLVADRRSWPSVLTWRSPSRSVRRTCAPCARRRATVSGAGWP